MMMRRNFVIILFFSCLEVGKKCQTDTYNYRRKYGNPIKYVKVMGFEVLHPGGKLADEMVQGMPTQIPTNNGKKISSEVFHLKTLLLITD